MEVCFMTKVEEIEKQIKELKLQKRQYLLVGKATVEIDKAIENLEQQIKWTIIKEELKYLIRTVVCQRDGCSGNKFYIETKDGNLEVKCEECGNIIIIDANYNDYLLISACSSCSNDTFKLFRDIEKDAIYAKCTECGGSPDKIYIDSDGVQVSYEGKLMHDIKDLMNRVDQRICNLQIRVESIERGQQILEESLAYMNKYMIAQNKWLENYTRISYTNNK